MARLGDYIEQIRGVSYKPDDICNPSDTDAVAILRANNIQDDGLNFDDLVYVKKSKVSDKQYIQQGDIVVCASSGSKSLVGKAAIATENCSISFGAFCKVVRPKKLIPSYLGYFFQSPKYRSTISELSGGANINNIRNEHIDELDILIISEEKQESIANKLDALSNLISLRKQQLSKLDKLVKARFVEMFGDPKTNDKKWEMKTFGDICTVRQGLQIPISKRLTHYEDDCYEYITVAYLHGSKEKEYIKSPKNTVVCSKDDVLMTRTGNTGMVITDVSGVFHNNFFLIDFDRSKYSKKFLVEYLNLDLIQSEIIKRAGTSTIPDLNHGQFYAITIYEPPIELQNEFATFVEQIDKSKLQVQQSLEKLETLKKSLMQQYFG